MRLDAFRIRGRPWIAKVSKMPKYIKGKTIQQIRAAVAATLKQLPTIAGVEAVNHFKNSFRNEGFTDSNLVKWQKRKKEDAGRGILTKTGRLRRSIKILRKTDTMVQVGVNLSEVPYAKVHNEGFKGTVDVKGHVKRNRRYDVFNVRRRRLAASGINIVGATKRKMNMPKRQFIGNSRKLNEAITQKTASALKKALS